MIFQEKRFALSIIKYNINNKVFGFLLWDFFRFRWTRFFYRFFLRASLIMPVNVCVCVFESIYVCFFCVYFYFYAFVSLDVWMKETFLVAFSAKMIMCASFTSLANSTRIDANLQEIIRIWALKRDIDKTLHCWDITNIKRIPWWWQVNMVLLWNAKPEQEGREGSLLED